MPLKNIKGLTIQKLVEQIRLRLIKEFGRPIQFLNQITTPDSFIYAMDDLVEDVLCDGATLIVLTNDEFKTRNMKYCSNRWALFERRDLKGGFNRRISIGLHENNKIFVIISPNENDLYKLRLFIIESDKFSGIPIAGSPIICTLQDDDENTTWFIEVRFWLSDKKIIQGLESVIKTSSDKQTWVDGIMIGVNKNGSLVKGNIVHLKGSDDEEEEPLDFDLPDPERVGPIYDVPKVIEWNPLWRIGLNKINAVAMIASENTSCDLNMLPKFDGSFEMEWGQSARFLNVQDYWGCEKGELSQLVEFQSITMTNKRLDRSSITKIRGFWLDHHGQWQPLDHVGLGVLKDGKWDYKLDLTMNFEAQTSQSITLFGRVKFPGQIGYEFRRLHNWLPEPLFVKFEILDQDSYIASQTFEVLNPIKEFETKKSFMAREKIKSCDFIFCDNLVAEQRLWAGVFKKNNMICTKFSRNYSTEWNRNQLDTFVFNANEEKLSEAPIKAFTHRDEWGNTFCGYIVTDLKSGKAYALKFELKTGTGSSCIEYVKIPKFSTPKKGLKPFSIHVTPSKVNFGGEIEITFNIAGHVPQSQDILVLCPEGSQSTKSFLHSIRNTESEKYGMKIWTVPTSSTNITVGAFQWKYLDKDLAMIACSEPFFIEK